MPGARNGRTAFMRSLLVALSNPKGLLAGLAVALSLYRRNASS